MHPARLDRNQPSARFYRGGSRIAEFRGVSVQGEFEPEDWVGSTTEVTGEPGVGLTTLPDGRTLREAVSAAPEDWLGAEHVTAFGASTEVLTKLLDAGERLPVHIHPSRQFASAHLHSSHGKTEAWIYLNNGTAHLGFRSDVSEEQILPLLRAGESTQVLELMHELSIKAGDVVFCPPGIPHAIGAGSFLVEVQEPTDLSIFLEWKEFPLPGGAAGHLGLDDVTAAEAVSAGISRDDVDGFVSAHGGTVGDLLVGTGAPFRADRLGSGDRLDAGFTVLIVVAGSGRAVNEAGEEIELSRGSTYAIPHAWGPTRIEGDSELEAVAARPPLPTA